MATLEDAKTILHALELPRSQQTDIAAYTLLALSGLAAAEAWSATSQRPLRIHEILQLIKQDYGKSYAENTRETIRKEVLQPFVQARMLDQNPDDPGRPTNSPNNRYRLTDAALRVLQAFGTPDFPTEVDEFRRNQSALLDLYRASRRRNMLPVKTASGQDLPSLTPGKHNELQAAVVYEFARRFAPGAIVLYLGDAADKDLVLEKDLLESLRVPITEHDKLPDVILYDADQQRLFLIEAVTSRGPVSPKRRFELEQALTDSGCQVARIYVTAFADLKQFKRHVHNIAWESEVWLADNPDHLIHFNGDKFLGSSGDPAGTE